MTANTLRFQSAALTDPGKVRSNNEDSLLARPEDGLWVVADGMGGHSHGQWASAAITEALAAANLSQGFEETTASVAEAIHSANNRIWTEAQATGSSMGSTVVALLLRDARFTVFWAGDSRCYLLRGGSLYQLNTDHSQVQDMVAAGRLTPEEALDHPMAHVLSRAVGVQAQLELDAVSDAAAAGDVYLVCSDGLTRTISDPELATILGGANPEAMAKHLIELCLDRGAPDNVTVAVVMCDATTLLAFR